MKFYALVAGQCVYIGEYSTWDDMEYNVPSKDWDSFDWIFEQSTLFKFVWQATKLLEQADGTA